MSESSVPVAKVYVWKVDGDEEPWKVGSGIGEAVFIHYEATHYREAWQWLEQNYVREAP